MPVNALRIVSMVVEFLLVPACFEALIAYCCCPVWLFEGIMPIAPPAAFKPAPVQLTNSSSIKSKAAMEAAGYISGFNYNLFLSAPPIRSALINRGYFIRVHCLWEQIKAYCRLHSDFQVVSLGCGWDTCWMRIQEVGNCSLWIDADFEALLQTKRRVFEEASVEMPAFYQMLSMDLTDLNTVQRQLEGISKEKPTLFLAECSLTYLPVEQSDALLAFLSGAFGKATLLIYEQVLGEAGFDAFSKTMCEHFDSISTPIHSLHAYPRLQDQLSSRFAKAGFRWKKSAFTLDSYWNEMISPGEKQRIASLEVFDEWEDWHVKLAHYFVAMLSDYPESKGERTVEEELKIDAFHSPFNATFTPIPTGPKVWGHAAALLANGTFLSFGGFHHRRLEGMRKFTLSHLADEHSLDAKVKGPGGRLFCGGGLLPWRDDVLLMFGGRKSPTQPLGELWKYSICSGGWQLVETEGAPCRFRHCSWIWRDKLYVFGGIGLKKEQEENAENVQNTRKNKSCSNENISIAIEKSPPSSQSTCTFGDLWVLDLLLGKGKWKKIPLSFPTSLLQRHSASSSLVSFQGKPHALISGGLSPDEQALNDILLIPLIDGCFVPEGNNLSTIPTRISGIPNLQARYSHSCTVLEGGLLALIGGVLGGIGLSKRHFIQLVDLNDFSRTAQSVVVQVEGCFPTGINSQLVVDRGEGKCGKIYLLGGGLNCFSMGSFYDSSYEILISRADQKEANSREYENQNENESENQNENESENEAVGAISSDLAHGSHVSSTTGTTTTFQSKPCFTLKPSAPLKDPSWRVTVHEGPLTSERWNQLYEKREPVLFRGVPFMKQDWNLDFLFKAVLPETLISIHNAFTPILDFTTRNFDFKILPFSELLANLYDPQYTKDHFFYLRSIGQNPRKEQADIEQSFPGLSESIEFPWAAIPQMRDSYFSSILRVTSPRVELWTHYDVMDNILFQIKGSKTITLWHPSDYPYLSLEGSSSRVTDIENAKCPDFFHSVPTRFELKEGEFLFIPSLVFHHTRCSEVPSWAVNSFWRHLPVEAYGKKDLYGNKDLQAAANALQEQGKALEQLKSLPEWYRDFYHHKLQQQLDQTI
jgi:O-methyltransferase involved in polyketide biosynthesis